MKGDPRVLKALNDMLRKELTGINQQAPPVAAERAERRGRRSPSPTG